MHSYLDELYRHQEWADTKHWRAFEAHAALDDKAIRERVLRHLLPEADETAKRTSSQDATYEQGRAFGTCLRHRSPRRDFAELA